MLRKHLVSELENEEGATVALPFCYYRWSYPQIFTSLSRSSTLLVALSQLIFFKIMWPFLRKHFVTYIHLFLIVNIVSQYLMESLKSSWTKKHILPKLNELKRMKSLGRVQNFKKNEMFG